MTNFQAIKRQDDNCQNKNAMDKKAIYNCKKQLIQNNLGDALKAISELKNNHYYSSLHERISKIQDDYHLMLSYYRNGFPDPSRDCLYNSLLRKLDRIANDAALIQRLILYPSKPDFIKRRMKSNQRKSPLLWSHRKAIPYTNSIMNSCQNSLTIFLFQDNGIRKTCLSMRIL